MSKGIRLRDLERERFDLVIVGSGLAGLSTAFFAAKEKGKSIALITKSREVEGSSYHAQGGIAVALNKKDSVELHARDTLSVGDGLCDELAVKVLVKEGVQRVKELMDLGLEFDENSEGLAFGREAAHSVNRILHINGDGTGKNLTLFVLRLVEEQGNVSVITKSYVTDVVEKNGEASGLLVKEQNGEKLYEANAVVLSTGGYGALYENFTNPKNVLGSGVSIAHRIGAKAMDLEFFQFHPTTVSVKGKENFLISEAVRGEGAKVVNGEGNRFLKRYDSRAELAPRDVVSRAVFEELMQGGKVFMDCSEMKVDAKKRFPGIYRELKEKGFRMEKDLIPIEPAAHYSIGGIAVDLNGRSSVKGLYANGEGSCNKAHGANRLASNSLLDAIVFGARAGRTAVKEKRKPLSESSVKKEFNEKKGNDSLGKLRELMWKRAGIIRNGKGLELGLKELNRLKKEAALNDSIDSLQAQNALLLAELCLKQMLARTESRGCHFRSDFPQKSGKWARHSII